MKGTDLGSVGGNGGKEDGAVRHIGRKGVHKALDSVGGTCKSLWLEGKLDLLTAQLCKKYSVRRKVKVSLDGTFSKVPKTFTVW